MSTKYGENRKTRSNLKISRKTNRKTTSKIVNVKITDIKPSIPSKKVTTTTINSNIVSANEDSNKAITNEAIPVKKKSIRIPKIVSTSKEHNSKKEKQTVPSVSNLVKQETEEILADEPKRNLKLNIPVTSTQSTYVKPDTSINQNSSFFYTPSVFERYKINITNIDDEIETNNNSTSDNKIDTINDDITDNIDNTIDTETAETADNTIKVENDNIEVPDKIVNDVDVDVDINDIADYENNYNSDATDTADYENNYDSDVVDTSDYENNYDTEIEEKNNYETDVNDTDNFENNTDSGKKDDIKSVLVSASSSLSSNNNNNMENTDDSYFAKVKKGIISNISSVFKKFSFEQNDLIDIDELDVNENLDNHINSLNETANINNIAFSDNTLANTDLINNTDLGLNNIESIDMNPINSTISISNSDEISIDMNSIDFEEPTVSNVSAANVNTLPVEKVKEKSSDTHTVTKSKTDEKQILITPTSDNSQKIEETNESVDTNNNDNNNDYNIDNNKEESDTSDEPVNTVDTSDMFSLDNDEYDDYQDIDYSSINLEFDDDDSSDDSDFSIEEYFGVSNIEPEKEKKSVKKIKTPKPEVADNYISNIVSETDTTDNSNNIPNSVEEPNNNTNVDIKKTELDELDILANMNDVTQTDTENNSSEEVENILSEKFSKVNNIDENMKNELLTELLNDEKLVENSDKTDKSKDSETISENDEFFTIIDTLAKTITELENSAEIKTPQPEQQEDSDGKSINILINKDDIFSISILNETYEIVADFDGISVLSENINISTPKKNFYVTVGEKYIEIHNTGSQFTVNTNFEDIEFANAINNVTFAKKNNKIELNVKEAFKLSSINNKVELSMLNTSVADMKVSNVEISETINEASICDNRTLLISEETQKVYLPYTIDELMHKLNNSDEYQTLEDVIENEYTVPLSTFKMPIISRFKEAYKFMRTKEHSSVYAALDLAIELMFNSNLNPAVIRASKDLKELNVYLDCLYENEIDKFDCFKIVYKVLPKIK